MRSSDLPLRQSFTLSIEISVLLVDVSDAMIFLN